MKKTPGRRSSKGVKGLKRPIEHDVHQSKSKRARKVKTEHAKPTKEHHKMKVKKEEEEQVSGSESESEEEADFSMESEGSEVPFSSDEEASEVEQTDAEAEHDAHDKRRSSGRRRTTMKFLDDCRKDEAKANAMSNKGKQSVFRERSFRRLVVELVRDATSTQLVDRNGETHKLRPHIEEGVVEILMEYLAEQGTDLLTIAANHMQMSRSSGDIPETGELTSRDVFNALGAMSMTGTERFRETCVDAIENLKSRVKFQNENGTFDFRSPDGVPGQFIDGRWKAATLWQVDAKRIYSRGNVSKDAEKGLKRRNEKMRRRRIRMERLHEDTKFEGEDPDRANPGCIFGPVRRGRLIKKGPDGWEREDPPLNQERTADEKKTRVRLPSGTSETLRKGGMSYAAFRKRRDKRHREKTPATKLKREPSVKESVEKSIKAAEAARKATMQVAK